MKIKKADMILIAVVLFLALGGITYFILTREEGAALEIKVNDSIYKTVSLNVDQEIRIDSGDGQYNLLLIKDGVATVSEANCATQDCVHQGNIHYNYESITCLPHKVIITIKGGEDSPIDQVAN